MEPLDSLGNAADFPGSQPLSYALPGLPGKAVGECALCEGTGLSELHRPRRSWAAFKFAEPYVLSSHPLSVETPAQRGHLICQDCPVKAQCEGIEESGEQKGPPEKA